MRVQLGVFATSHGWVVADQDHSELFQNWTDAIVAARRQAHLARWRGVDAEVVAQDHPGGSLIVIDPPRV